MRPVVLGHRRVAEVAEALRGRLVRRGDPTIGCS
jgi:hypothetical protein